MQLDLFGVPRPAAPQFDHIWFWNPRLPGEKNRKGLRGRILVRGGKNSILVELEDGERVVASRYALRRVIG